MFLVRPIVERLCQTPGQRAVSQRRPTINARLKCGRGFALYEVLLGVTIFVIGVVALGRSVQNCLTASTLSAEDSRVRLVLANRMAEIQLPRSAMTSTEKNQLGYGYHADFLHHTGAMGLNRAKGDAKFRTNLLVEPPGNH